MFVNADGFTVAVSDNAPLRRAAKQCNNYNLYLADKNRTLSDCKCDCERPPAAAVAYKKETTKSDLAGRAGLVDTLYTAAITSIRAGRTCRCYEERFRKWSPS